MTREINILLIEKDGDARLLFKQVLTGAGYVVEELSEGNHFINAGTSTPDLFIVDSSMPTIDGIALTKFIKIKETTRNIPVLIVSANPNISAKAQKAGASAFIAKPFKVDTLLSTVRKLLSEQHEN